MSALLVTAQELFGLFELATMEGPLLRRDAAGTSPTDGTQLLRRLRLSTRRKFRRCVTDFTRGVKAATASTSTATYEGPITPSECSWRASAST